MNKQNNVSCSVAKSIGTGILVLGGVAGIATLVYMTYHNTMAIEAITDTVADIAVSMATDMSSVVS